MNVIFLDIDGVLTSARTCIAYNEKVLRRFDPIAVKLLATICKQSDMKICISSTWRIERPNREDFIIEFGFNGGLPLIKYLVKGESWRTPILPSGNREEEINQWLADHPEANIRVAIDDDYLGSSLISSQVQPLTFEGFSFQNYLEVVDIIEKKALRYGKEPLESIPEVPNPQI